MKRGRFLRVSLLALLALLIPLAALAAAGGYALPWWTVDAGGGSSSGGNYTLNGTLAQPDAGTLTGGSYALEGGFWSGAAPSPEGRTIFLPLVIR